MTAVGWEFQTGSKASRAVISVENTVLIDRRIDDVWAFVSDPPNESAWHTDRCATRSRTRSYRPPPR